MPLSNMWASWLRGIQYPKGALARGESSNKAHTDPDALTATWPLFHEALLTGVSGKIEVGTIEVRRALPCSKLLAFS